MRLLTEPPDDEPCEQCGEFSQYRRGLCRRCYQELLEVQADRAYDEMKEEECTITWKS
jgi:hypothetical protein